MPWDLRQNLRKCMTSQMGIWMWFKGYFVQLWSSDISHDA